MDLHLDIERPVGKPVRARVEAALREAIRCGRLAPGTRLPSTRELCAELGISRGVVAEVYAQLAAEGYLRARAGAGTTVAATSSPGVSDEVRRLDARPIRYDLSPFRPALGSFPRTSWLAALARASRSLPDGHLGYPDPGGVAELRRALAAYLGRARGVQAPPEQILITSSLRQGLSLLWSVLAARGARVVALESPGWRGMRETAHEAGLASVEVSVDAHGLVVEELESLDVQAVAVAPAHQFPTGAVMSAARRGALAELCRRRDTLIVEDDYDAEYRYDRRPLGALQGLAPDLVVYGGSASKSMAPSMRLAWLALPASLTAPIAALQRLRGGMPAPLLQHAFAEIIERGELDRHLRRQRRSYRARRDALLEALSEQLPELPVTGAAAGLFVVVMLPQAAEEEAVLAAARANGLALQALGGRDPGIVVGYANLSEAAVTPAVNLLASSIRHSLRPHGQNVAS
jgi:GntR family transcriptional regulator/MocR family aminotransferase